MRALQFALRFALSLVIVVALGGPRARADDAPSAEPAPAKATPASVADAVLAAIRAKDTAALAALVTTDEDPDPWLVADELIARGEGAAADAFARTSKVPDVAKLPAWVASRKGKPDAPAARAAIDASNAAAAKKDWSASLAALSGASAPGHPLLTIRLDGARAKGFARLGRFPEAREVFRRAAEAAASLGWVRRQAQTLYNWADAAIRDGDAKLALDVAQRYLGISKVRGRPRQVADAYRTLAQAQELGGDYVAAVASRTQEVKAFEPLARPRSLAGALFQLSLDLKRTGDSVGRRAAVERGLAVLQGDPNAPVAGLLHESLGLMVHAEGKDAEARDHLEKALAIGEATHDDELVASSCVNLTSLESDLARRVALIERAVLAAEKSGSAVTLRIALIERCSLRNVERRYADALADATRARGLFKTGESAAQVAMSEGVALAALGRLAEAERSYREAIAGLDRFPDDLWRDRNAFRLYEQLGTLLASANRAQEGLDAAENALAIYRTRASANIVLARDVENRAAVLAIAADCLCQLDELAKADAYLAQAREILARIPSADSALGSAWTVAWKLADRRGNVGEAARAFGMALECVRRAGESGKESALHIQLSVRALRTGAFREALASAEAALEIDRGRADLRRVLLDEIMVGRARFGGGDRVGAIQSFESVVAQSRQRSWTDLLAFGLEFLAESRAAGHEWSLALKAQEEAFALREAGHDPAVTADSLSALSARRSMAGDGEGALRDCDRAATLAKPLSDAGAPLRSACIKINRARALTVLGRLREAADEGRGAFALASAAGDVEARVSALFLLAASLHDLGELAAGVDAARTALSIAEATRNARLLNMALDPLAEGLLRLGRPAEALTVLERALTNARERLGDTEVATVATIRGTAFGDVGRFEEAAASIAEAVALLERNSGDRRMLAQALVRAGEVLHAAGRDEEAVVASRRALALATELHDAQISYIALGNLAEPLSALGRQEEALGLCRASLAEAERIGGRANAASLRIGIAQLELQFGRSSEWPAALADLERAVEEASRLRMTTMTARGWSLVATAKLATGDVAGSIAAARRGVEALGGFFRGLADEEGAAARGVYASLFGVGARAAARLGDAAAVSGFLEGGRAGSLLETLRAGASVVRARLPVALASALRAAELDEASARRQLALATQGGRFDEIRVRAAAVDAAHDARLAVVATIQRDARRAADYFFPRAASLAEIEARLAPDEAFVTFAIDDEEALALVVRHTDARVVSLGKAAAIAVACEAVVGADATTDPAAFERVAAAVVAPLALPDDVRRLLVSPEGALSYVPWGAVVGTRDVAIEPSGTAWLALREEKRPTGTGVLALGDPAYATSPPVAGVAPILARGRVLGRLPGSGREALAVGDVTLIGTKATRPELVAALAKKGSRWRSVHFACHGLVDAAHPSMCALALAPSPESDGFLTALDVLDLKLDADLVVMSACETAKGKVARGEGILGLTRSFMFAGSPRVLCSLWKVDDDSTQLLMTKFYALWNPKDGRPGLRAAAALRQAQAYVRDYEVDVRDGPASEAAGHEVTRKARPYAHPAYWAAWVLWGLAE